MKILGVDHGNVRIGVSISDESGSLARPLTILTHVSREQDAEEVCKLCENHDCGLVVVGVPYDLDGGEGPRARSVLRFVRQLQSVSNVPVQTWDETLSTKTVIATNIQLNKSRSKRRETLDDKAAAVILQSYLDHRVQDSEGMDA